MELKKYQKRVLDCVRDYARLVDSTNGNGLEAYEEYLNRHDLHIGEGQVRSYSADLGTVPKVCVKVPTGGGKTFIAANALKVLDDNLPPVQARAVVWLVPRKEILRQTIRKLRDPADDLRIAIDRDFSHRVEVLDKEQGLAGRGLDVSSVNDQLTIFVLSYDSFKNKDGRKAYQENSALMQLTSYQKASGMAVDVEGADDTALISALAGLNPIVVVDESHHAKSDLSLGMLRNLNPRFVLELTATPSSKSNVIARVAALELKKEQMVKLPVIVYRRDGKREVVEDAILLQRRLKLIAGREREKTGRYIRPIVLFQAERKGNDDAETFRRLKEKIVAAGIPDEQIAIRTGDVDELKDVDLMSEECPIRFIITVEALSEGWDCPFAYILATVANKQSKTNVEQIVGRVLRQPYAVRAKSSALNISYVLTSSADFNETIDQVVAGLNGAGFSRNDVVASQTAEEPNDVRHIQDELADIHDDGSEADAGHEHDDLDGMVFTDVEPALPETPAETDGPAGRVDQIIAESAKAEEDFEQQVEETGDHAFDGENSGLREEDDMRYSIRNAVEESVRGLKLPRFMIRQQSSGNNLFAELDDGDAAELDSASLLENFHAGKCSTQGIRFNPQAIRDAKQIDVDGDSHVRVKWMSADQMAMTRALFAKDAPDEKRKTIRKGLLDSMRVQARRLYGDGELKRLLRNVVEDMDNEQLNDAYDNLGAYARIVSDEVDRQAARFKRDEFNRLRDTGTVYLDPCYELPASLALARPFDSLPNSLYEAEEDSMNNLERDMADMLANTDGILWWHRVTEKRHGEFSINGFINHYPDFLAMTRQGKVLAIETKGEMLKNDDSRDKLELGNIWANAAGDAYRYFMVFAHNPLEGTGAYSIDEFRQILEQIG